MLPEEALKLAWPSGRLSWPAGSGIPAPGLAAVPGATGFGAVENLAYMAAFPDAGVFLRLATLPLHVNAATLFALVGLKRPAAAAVGVSAVSAAVHAAFSRRAAATHPSQVLKKVVGVFVLTLAIM
ncbi:MAG: hypothetical protein MZV65_15735 [Chromatiales bacterium]|nr:hypothetical protein [Chromatiales bacterium]